MSLLLEIGDLPIILKGEDFLKSLCAPEKKLLHPFIRKRFKAALSKEKRFLFDPNVIDDSGPCKDYKIDPSLIRKLKTYFPKTKNDRFRRILDSFIRENLVYYLRENETNVKNLIHLIDLNASYNKIIIKRYAFILFNEKTRRGDLIYRWPFSSRNNSIETMGLYNLYNLRMLYRMLLNFKGDGILLHSSSIEKKGNGYIFIGPGSSGKSTVARLLRPDRILSDDAGIIRRINGEYLLFPNPWWSYESGIKICDAKRPARLKAVFFIKKGNRTALNRLSTKDALIKLVFTDSAFQQVGFLDNKSGVKNFYLFSHRITRRIPFFELEVKKHQGFEREFDKLMSRHLE